MARKPRFVFHRRALQSQILYGDGVDTLGALAATGAVQAAAGNAALEVLPGRSSNRKRGGRARIRIYGSIEDEAVNGTLSRLIGLPESERKVWYTTKSGKRRLATRAQVENWTRGAR